MLHEQECSAGPEGHAAVAPDVRSADLVYGVSPAKFTYTYTRLSARQGAVWCCMRTSAGWSQPSWMRVSRLWR